MKCLATLLWSVAVFTSGGSAFALLTYGNDVKPILDAHCIECHDSGADLNLTVFPFVSSSTTDQNAIVDDILGKVSASPPQMPPGNRPKLSADDIGTIKQWQTDGLLP
jgi:hypothetical protein